MRHGKKLRQIIVTIMFMQYESIKTNLGSFQSLNIVNIYANHQCDCLNINKAMMLRAFILVTDIHEDLLIELKQNRVNLRLLIHLPVDKMISVSQTASSTAFPWMKKVSRFFKTSFKFVPRETIDNNPSLKKMMAWSQAIIWTNTDTVHCCIYAALGEMN